MCFYGGYFRRRGPRVFMFGFGPWDFAWGYRSRRELIRELEEYKKELEEELEDVNERIKELKREMSEA
mgnify:CR=1 FL=1